MIRVLITDDHAIVRDGLRQVVSETADIVIGAEAANAAETLDRLREAVVDVIVLDLNLPDRHGLDLLAQLRASYPAIPVLILSVNRDAGYAVRLMKAGAAGYIGKDSAREQLVHGIRTVARGEKFLQPELAANVAFHLFQHGDTPAHERLSDREFQVLLLIAAGKPPREIAGELNLAVKTVGAHRANILEKMGLRNNAEIVQYVMTNKL
jgi:two-component system invasion response regulator UvrY